MDWRQIPSLSALRAFEATARLNGFSAAGRELNVTHAAIAQHVRGLEDFFGCSLMVREGRGMQLTQAGHKLATSISEGFEVIAGGVQSVLRDREDAPLKLALTPTFAENWLMPRLGGFWAEHPLFALALVPSLELVDLKREDFDLAIRYGHGAWHGLTSELLAPANYVVIGTPALVEGWNLKTPCDLSQLRGKPWVMAEGRDEEKLWAKANGLDIEGSQGSRFPTNSLVLSAVRAGVGLSIQGRALVEDDLASGALVCLCEEPASTLGYYIVMRDGPISERLKTFLTWLRGVA